LVPYIEGFLHCVMRSNFKPRY